MEMLADPGNKVTGLLLGRGGELVPSSAHLPRLLPSTPTSNSLENSAYMPLALALPQLLSSQLSTAQRTKVPSVQAAALQDVGGRWKLG